MDKVDRSALQESEPGPGLDWQPDAELLKRIIRAIREIHYGSVEIIIHNSRIVQIERREKIRVDSGIVQKR